MIVDSNRSMKPQQALPVAEKSESVPLLEEKPSPIQNEQEEDDDEEDPICGPAETITGEIRIVLGYCEDSTNDCDFRNY